jgi:nitrite reductase/ring-hydroxylating ferredoxin subunit
MTDPTELHHPDRLDRLDRLDRRRLLCGAALLGVGVPVLAACGSDGPSATGDPASTGSGGASGSPAGSGKGSGGGAGAGGELVATADVPVGGGVVLDGQKIVVTQPSQGEFKAFTAICTHQGCLVGGVADNTITCPCHGSQYSAEDGSVITGPATRPLTAVDVTVKSGSVVES